MAIITHINGYKTPEMSMLQLFPDQMIPEKEKLMDQWKKINMDYFYAVAINKYAHNKHEFARNYEILKGVLRREDFYETPEIKSFYDTLTSQEQLPEYVKHFSILSSPINDLIGEMSKRPDNTYVKAFDDDSKNERLQFRTQILQQWIIQNAKERIVAQAAQKGVQLDEDQEDKMTREQVMDYMTSYTSMAEKWGARMLDYLKVRFSMKEKGEDAFRDLLITAREFFHIYEDKSDEGFNIEVLNPKNVWFVSTPDEKYVSDPFDRHRGAFAAGTIEIMELSEILYKFDLDIEEIEHLKRQSQQNYLLSGHDSNLVSPKEGHDGIQYDIYNPLLLQERMLLESELRFNNDELSTFLLPGSEISTFGNKYIVIRAYWCSKKKIGHLTYVDQDGQQVSTNVDESYNSGEHPQQVSLEWGWINQWYKGVKIGPDVYHVEQFELLDYCPIIGSIFENKNAEAKSLLDMLKPFQTLCNIYMNKLYESIQKDIGPVYITTLRSVPMPKDGDSQDAIAAWMGQARDRGVMFVDDNPENLAAAQSFNQHRVQDMSRVKEMQGYFDMYFKIKQEAYELVGISRQRLGSIQATETATATNTALSQSYAQTETLFNHHEYTSTKVYQGILDAAQYIQCRKPESVISLISNEGEEAFMKINGEDLKLPQLGVLVTSRSEDAQNFRDLRMLAQPMLQNGASPYDIVAMYTTKSVRQLKDTLKRLKDDHDQMLQSQQALEQQKVEQQQQQFQQAQQLQIAQHNKDTETDNMNKALDRESKERVAIIQATGFGKVESEDLNRNQIPDVLEQQKLLQGQSKTEQEYELRIQELNQKQQEILSKNSIEAKKMELEQQKLQVERERTKSQEKIAKANKNKSK